MFNKLKIEIDLMMESHCNYNLKRYIKSFCKFAQRVMLEIFLIVQSAILYNTDIIYHVQHSQVKYVPLLTKCHE